jgi:hypothetical protein
MNARSEKQTPAHMPHWLFGILWVGLLAAVVAAFWFGGAWLRASEAPMAAHIAATLAYGLIIVAVASMPGLRSMKLKKVKKDSPGFRYAQQVMGIMTVYVFVLTAVIFTFIVARPTGPVAILLAILPAIPVVVVFTLAGRFLARVTDEFLRTVMTQSILWATGATLALATVWGFLELFRVVPHVPMVAIAPLWSAMLVPAGLIVWRKYR